MPCNPSVHGKHTGSDADSVVSPGAFSVAFGNPDNAFPYGMSVLAHLRLQTAEDRRESSPLQEENRPVESLGPQQSALLSARLKDALHVYSETLTPAQFLDGAKTFLSEVGMTGLTEISVDEQPVQPRDSTMLSLQEAADACQAGLEKSGTPVRTMEISSHGKNDSFSLLLSFSYSRRHRSDTPPVTLEIRAMSNELGPKQGESFSDYRTRMKTIDMDRQKRAKLYEAIETEKKALYSDFAHHLTEAFPGVRLQLFESVTPSG